MQVNINHSKDRNWNLDKNNTNIRITPQGAVNACHHIQLISSSLYYKMEGSPNKIQLFKSIDSQRMVNQHPTRFLVTQYDRTFKITKQMPLII